MPGILFPIAKLRWIVYPVEVVQIHKTKANLFFDYMDGNVAVQKEMPADIGTLMTLIL